MPQNAFGTRVNAFASDLDHPCALYLSLKSDLRFTDHVGNIEQRANVARYGAKAHRGGAS